ncbi:MAG: phosphoglucosamine mutase [Candidatus Lindowbacteria bacterium]|nr:phosphoglucosamine mutase [Candidatus Lindowbacteria bacterium]
MKIPSHPRLKLSEAGLRGVVGETLTPPLTAGVAAAFASLMPPGALALGRDTRLSSPMLLDLVASAIRSVGHDVIDLGICPVLTIEYFVRTKGLSGGIDVTASHNPQQWNALKFIGKGGYFLDKQEALEIRDRLEEGVKWNSFDTLGSRTFDDTAADLHINRILEAVDADLIRSKNFTVAIDCVNGSASAMTHKLSEKLGCKVVSINTEFDAGFPHPPEPKPENLKDLIKLAGESGADIGFAQDPDADRLACIADKGIPLSEEYTFVLATEHVLSHKPGRAVVGNLSGSRMLEDVAKKYGSDCYRTIIGEINVSKKLREVKGAIGGEGNGGVMIPEIHEGRDSFTGMALLLEMMAERNEPISAIVDSIPKYSMLKFQQEIEPERIADSVGAFESAFDNDAEIDRQDGLKLSWPDRWIHVRGSNTEPIIRVMLEAPTPADAEELMAKAKALL